MNMADPHHPLPERCSHDSRRRRDAGNSLAEMLVVIVLMGLVVTAVLAGFRVSVRASTTDRNHATAFAWLQAASDDIYSGARVPCTTDGQGRTDAMAAYSSLAQGSTVPPSWSKSDGTAIELASIKVIDVEYLGRVNVDDDFQWSPTFCFEGGAFVGSPLFTQRVTIEVTFPNGDTRQTLEMVKSER